MTILSPATIKQALLMAPKPVLIASPPLHPNSYEQEHVHAVYDTIASHFSSTRYKPWPIVAAFLHSIPTGWVGLDSGTGNGKYISMQNPSSDGSRNIWTIGLDRSFNLLKIAQNACTTSGRDGRTNCNEVVQGDAVDNCWRLNAFDYAISIATIHHLTTVERRIKAVKVMLQCLSPKHGRALIYVWATQQDELSKRSMPAPELSSKRHGLGQDVFVPWVLSNHIDNKQSKSGDGGTEVAPVYNRFYHMFDEGELRELVCKAAVEIGLVLYPDDHTLRKRGVRYIEIVRDGWEKSNFYVELELSIG